MKKTALTLIILSFSSPAFAQGAVESEPLKPFVPYTLQGETDPMALGAPQQDSGNTATPARGSGYAPILSSDDAPPPAPQTITPDYQTKQPQERSFPPTPLTPVQHNVVSAAKREDLSKFENRIVCTLKMSFASAGAGIDQNTATAAKSYLDANKDKASYTQSQRGNKGEFSYCVMVPQHRDQAEIYQGMKNLMPPVGSKAGPVTLSGKAFTPLSTVRYQTYRD